MIVSLERAYHTFLAHEHVDESKKLTKMEYLVYAHFMRFGCNLRRFKNELPSLTSSSSPPPSSSAIKCSEYADCSNGSSNCHADNVDNYTCDKLYVWNYLDDLLGHRRTILTAENIDRNHYTRIKQSMNNIINNFKDHNPIDPDPNESGQLTEPPQKRRRKSLNVDASNVEHATMLPELYHKNGLDDPYLGSGPLNDFMIGNTFKRFKEIFDKIDIIELKTMDYADENGDRDNSTTTNASYHNYGSITEKFSFDLWTSQDYRRSQPKPPNFRLIVK